MDYDRIDRFTPSFDHFLFGQRLRRERPQRTAKKRRPSLFRRRKN